MYIVVAVVDNIGLEAGMGYLLDVHRHKGEVCTQLVSSLTLLHRSTEGIGLIIMVVENRLDASAVLMQFGGSMLLGFLLGFHLGRYHLAHGIVVLLYHYHIVHRGRNLKSVLILHQYDVLTLEARDSAASHLTQESYFISYFHCVSVFYFRYKDTQSYRNMRNYLLYLSF